MFLKINRERLQQDILELAEIGRDSRGGISRPSFSEADFEARDWLKHKIEEAGLACREDGAGNIFAHLGGEGPVVMAGSHLDTVFNGGRFDGAAGVLAALEALRRVKEENVPLSLPLEMASFTDEEGNLVGDFLGSRAFVGALDENLLYESLTSFGRPLADILQATPFSLESILDAHLHRPELTAFLELHIEQGPTLETEGKEIGIVDKIAGKQDWLCLFLGETNHAGTTPFELRHDAFLALAELSFQVTHYVAQNHYGSFFTVSSVQTWPRGFSLIPGQAEFTIDFRSTDAGTLDDISSFITKTADSISQTRGVDFKFKVIDSTQPVEIQPMIINLLEEEAGKLDYSFLRLPSRAGHDAQILAQVTPVGLIFIPCEDGISHSPEENIRWEDLEKGANLLLNAMVRLAS
ncbi:MAG TPA: Zn-dependent hydrolase [Candidatus Aminicenantes bacterium]|nr:Zn-dependent hydrolase [Candidatus Aminicenantes bacterium]